MSAGLMLLTTIITIVLSVTRAYLVQFLTAFSLLRRYLAQAGTTKSG